MGDPHTPRQLLLPQPVNDAAASADQPRSTAAGPTGWNPPPTVDPTEQSQRALDREATQLRREIKATKDLLSQRLDGIDQAVDVKVQTVTDQHHEIEGHIGHVRELTDEKFSAVTQQFKERDIRSEREARDNKVAVDAAFAAQKESAAETNKSNTLAIAKSEEAQKETVDKLGELFTTAVAALTDKVDDQKERTGGLEVRIQSLLTRDEAAALSAAARSRETAAGDRLNNLELRLSQRLDRGEGVSAGGRDSRTERRAEVSQMVAVAGFALALILAVITIALAMHK